MFIRLSSDSWLETGGSMNPFGSQAPAIHASPLRPGGSGTRGAGSSRRGAPRGPVGAGDERHRGSPEAPGAVGRGAASGAAAALEDDEERGGEPHGGEVPEDQDVERSGELRGAERSSGKTAGFGLSRDDIRTYLL